MTFFSLNVFERIKTLPFLFLFAYARFCAFFWVWNLFSKRNNCPNNPIYITASIPQSSRHCSNLCQSIIVLILHVTEAKTNSGYIRIQVNQIISKYFIIRTGITCKKILSYMCNSSCRQFIKLKIFKVMFNISEFSRMWENVES